ncbi:MAG: hypothetical protein KJ587_09725 [Alphaproteobacteria bacterium]|nr:hypothetical protein [Alphaproteobacteria bacterium]
MIGKGMLAGFAATLVLSAIMFMKSMMGLMPQLDVIGMLSGMLGTSLAVGWLVHFIIGTVFYGAALALLAPSLPGGPTVSGVILGVAGWLMMMVLIMPMAGQGMFGMNLGMEAPVMTLMLHLIFGAVLGWTYGKLVANDVSEPHRRSTGAGSFQDRG